MSHFSRACHRFACAGRAAGPFTSEDERAFALVGDTAQWAGARPFAIESLIIRVDLDLTSRSLEGECDIEVRRIDPDAEELVLDAVEFEAASLAVVQGSARVQHRYDGERLWISAAAVTERATFRIRYRCSPRRGLYFVTRRPPRTAPNDREAVTEVWSQGQDQDNRCWFPCVDHPYERMRTEMIATVPRGFFVLSNGTLFGRMAEGDRETFHWKQEMPHPSYLVTLVAGRFEEAHQTSSRGLPVDFYVPQGEGEKIERSLGRTRQMIELFEAKLGTPFPWDKYAQVVVSDFIFGGMENTSATTLYDRALLDSRAAIDVDMDSLVAHELAHQWFGDLVTCRDWSHAWLNEGFATYLEHVWREHAEGPDAYFYGVEQDLDVYLEEDRGRYRRPIVTNVWAAPIDIFDRHLYQKGGVVLHALRMHLGDALFFKGLATYLARMRGKGAETRDLLRAMEDATGRPLEALFEQWLMRPGHPQLEISSEHEGRVLRITIVQIQAKSERSESLFELALPLSLSFDDGTIETHVLPVRRARETFALPCTRAPRMILVDPRSHVPGTLELKFGTALLDAQLNGAESAQPRWRAARALGRKNEPRATAALIRALSSDSFWGVRAEAAAALGEHRSDAALDALARAEGDSDARVRKSVALAFGKYRNVDEGDLGARAAGRLAAWIDRGDPSYLVEAEVRRSLGKTRDPRAKDRLLRCLEEDEVSWAEVVRQGTVDGLAALREVSLLSDLMTLSNDREAATVRRSAIVALGRAREVTSEEPTLLHVHEAVERALTAFDVGVRVAAVRALASLRQAGCAAALSRVADHDLDGRVRRAAREASRDVRNQAADRRELGSVRDELDRMRIELRELRTQLASLSTKLS